MVLVVFCGFSVEVGFVVVDVLASCRFGCCVVLLFVCVLRLLVCLC